MLQRILEIFAITFRDAGLLRAVFMGITFIVVELFN